MQKENHLKVMVVGSCQVSSTLYNALLEINNIEILEKHEHSKQVYYVPKGKDAAVDFLFLNTFWKPSPTK